MSAVPTNRKRGRQSASQAPALHSGEDRVAQIGEWESTTTGQLCEFITSGSRDWKSYYSDTGAYFIRTQDINQDILDLSSAARVKLPDRVEGKRSRVLPGDLLITITGANVGKIALVPDQIEEAYVSQSVGLMRLKDKRFAPYLHYYLQSEECGRKQVLGLVYGIGRPVLSLQNLRDIPVALPSLYAQRKIIAEIEKQFTRLDAGVAALRRVQANLKRYSAAVLKAACEGRLVPTESELAKAEGRAFETGEQLLARMLADRRKNWPGRGKYKEPAGPEATNLPPLPEGWAWARLEQLGTTYGGLTKNPKRAKLPNQLPYLRVANVYANELRLDDIEYIGVADVELAKLLVRAGDLLIVEGNGSKDQIGRLAIWDGSINPCVHQNHLIRVRLVNPVMSKWILYWLQSAGGRHFVELVASSTSGLYTLSVNKVGDMPILLPPLAEQTRIVAEVERRLSTIEELKAAVAANLQRATRLRQSILRHAFNGYQRYLE